jgi:hypothetical protein
MRPDVLTVLVRRHPLVSWTMKRHVARMLVESCWDTFISHCYCYDQWALYLHGELVIKSKHVLPQMREK